MSRHLVVCLSLIVQGLGVAVPNPAEAADTVETFDVGVTDVEVYSAVDGIGPETNAGTPAGELMIGIGIMEGFSVYLGTSLQADHHLSSAEPGFYFGVFGTALDTDHFDLDLMLDASGGGEGFSEFAVAPGLEVNFDLVPDLGLWGMYLRGGVPIAGHQSSQDLDGNPEYRAGFHIDVTVGTYYSISGQQQLLLEYDMAFSPGAGAGEGNVGIGGVALGYNIVIADPIELIAQVYLDIPQRGEQRAVGAMLGFIGTLPSAG